MTCQQPTIKQGANACVMGEDNLYITPIISMGVFSLWVTDIKEELIMSTIRLDVLSNKKQENELLVLRITK